MVKFYCVSSWQFVADTATIASSLLSNATSASIHENALTENQPEDESPVGSNFLA